MIERGLNWMQNSSAAALSLIYGGVLDAFPELEVVHPHAGGVLPFLLGRLHFVESTAFSHGPLHRPALAGVEYLRRNFFVDTVNTTPGAIDMAARMYGEERIVFGTEYPYVPRAQVVDAVKRGGHAHVMAASGPAGLRLASST